MTDPRARLEALQIRRGARPAYRTELARVIDLAREAVAAGAGAPARATLARALAARAEDARYGAGQLSRSAQRAPTDADTEDGWAKVEAIVATAEAAAREAADVARHLGAAARAVHDAAESAREARRVVRARNRAFTFHADPGFSFGEGWYLAAAAALEEVPIQVEPDRPQTAQVERFLRDAGLERLSVPYRPRPRANKPLTDIVARGFRRDPAAAQRRVRQAFVGDGPLHAGVVAWADQGLAEAPGPKILLWVRYARHHPDRNTDHEELCALAGTARRAGLVPVLVGDALAGAAPEGAVDWTLFWRQPLFQGVDMRRAQLHLFEHLMRAHDLRGQLGVTTAGMDGPALIGLPTMYLTAAPNPRMGAWVGAVPGYEEVVRTAGYAGRVEAGLSRYMRPRSMPCQ